MAGNALNLRKLIHGSGNGSRFKTTSLVCRQQLFATAPAARIGGTPEKPTVKDEIVVDSQEYSKSGFDSWAAENKSTAFSPKEDNAPETELQNAKQESERRGQTSNPLDVSPANREVASAYEHEDSPGGGGTGQPSVRAATPKGKTLPRYQEGGAQRTFPGTGYTHEEEKPGPAFPSARGRATREQHPDEARYGRKYVGGGR